MLSSTRGSANQLPLMGAAKQSGLSPSISHPCVSEGEIAGILRGLHKSRKFFGVVGFFIGRATSHLGLGSISIDLNSLFTEYAPLRGAPPVSFDSIPQHRRRGPITCDATPCDGFFQYDGPNQAPNATEIIFAENMTYTYPPGKPGFFIPEFNSTSPEECVQEWKSSQGEYTDRGMSSHREDLIIFDNFFSGWNREKKGFYMEIGGHDGARESNTRFFDICLGWDGLLVEPVPQNYARMVKLRPNAYKLGMAPSCNASDVAMFTNHRYTNAVANEKDASLKIHCGPLSAPLRQLGVRHVDFWSLDVEGSELATLRTVDFGVVQIDVIIAESFNRLAGKEEMAKEVKAFLQQKGYIPMESVRVYKSDVFLHKSACARFQSSNFTECVGS